MFVPATATPDMLIGIAVALGSGLLIGVERERHKAESSAQHVAGIRTFALIALAGAICALLDAVLVAVGAGFVGLAALLSYRDSRDIDPGLTTEVAMFVVFLLGVLAMTAPALAAGLAAGVALTLALKTRLHAFTRTVLTEQELHDALLLIAAALIVLPLLPNRTIDPWQVFNPHRLWLLVVLVMGINALGYVAMRALGTRLGLPLSGLAGGFVSATATIGAMGNRARMQPRQLHACVAAGTLANVATVIQLALVIGTLAPALLHTLALPLAAAGGVTLLFALLSGFAAWRQTDDGAALLKGRPFEPRHALLFAALVAGILLLSAALFAWFGDYGAIATAAIAGFADTHAAAASVAQIFAAERMTADMAGIGILLGLASNTLSKLLAASLAGGRDYAWRLLPGLVLLVAAFAGTLLLG